MPTRLEAEIKRQLDEGHPIDIDEHGEILLPNNNAMRGNGVSTNPVTGKPTTRLKPQRWSAWYEDNPGRILSEKQAMSKRFPHFQLVKTAEGLTWTGYLYPKGIGSYRIALSYPSDYPYSPPKVWIIEPKINAPKHQFSDGHLCLMEPSDGTWQTNTTAVTILAMATAWLWCNEYHQRHCGCSEIPCSKWPGNEV